MNNSARGEFKVAKADLHVHSKYSDHPSEWFLQRLGTNESYTEPEFIYTMAKRQGMTFVTITDHNKLDASLILKEKYPDEVFTGVESTAYFPEDRCKIHILIFGIDEKQFAEIQHLRKDIYNLRDFLKQEKIVHSVAHPTFSVNGKISFPHLEKLMILFDIFEGINGGRNLINNETWMNTASLLTPDHISDLYKKYRIEPFSDTPWIKGFTAGSDDHAGLFMGRTYTTSKAQNIESFLDNIKNKKSAAEGRHNNYKSLAFSFYKIAYDFSKHKQGSMGSAFLKRLNEFVFESKDLNLVDKYQVKRLKSLNRKNGNDIHRLLYELVREINDNKIMPIDSKLDIVYNKIAEIADAFFKMLLQSLTKNIDKVNIIDIIKNISASVPGIFLSVPFFSTIKHMCSSQQLLGELTAKYGNSQPGKKKKILWFTDTLFDMNGVSVTLQKLGSLAHEKNLGLHIITAFDGNDKKGEIPKNTINLPSIFSFRLPGYERYDMKIPSVLKSIETIYQYGPDEIIISTPGPVGLLGLLAAHLLNVKSIGIYHTDFKLHASALIKDESVVHLIENASRSFYSAMDEIHIPTKEYIHLLENRGFDLHKMKVFRRGIDADLFSPIPRSKLSLEKRYDLKEGATLLYAGRISQEKGLDFLIDVYRKLLEKRDDINMLIVGDGPYLKTLKSEAKDCEKLFFTGPIPYESMPEYYSGSDLFVFPSTTDTFGMVVLEAQACGLPAIVSDKGGPKEIVIDHKTGFVVAAENISEWVGKIEFLIEMMESYPPRYYKMKQKARNNALENYDWNVVLQDLMGTTDWRKKKSYIGPETLAYAT
jgi:glycosyltransferase involved in cell wall biosynthesis/predicted metal-dependent phosphoesterase TrpH